MKPIEHFEAGELQQAVATALESVKSAPTDLEKRMILCQMLSFAGDFERADKQLDLLTTQSPDVAISLAEFRQLIRAEQARRDFYTNGRLPEFLGEPTESQKLQLKASIALREGNAAEAGTLLNEALEISPEIQGTCNGEAFTGFRDLDDLLGTTIELLTNNGKYYWVPAERIRELSFAPAEAYHHLLWRRAEIRVEDGPEGVVYLPAIYANPGLDDDDKMKLGRMTDWHEVPEGPILGIGQKTWLVGENDLPIMNIETLSVSTENE